MRGDWYVLQGFEMALLTPPALLHKDKDKDPDAEPDKDGEAAGPVSVTRVWNSLVSGKPNIMCGGWCLASLTGASCTAVDLYAVDSFVRARFVERGLVDFWSACLCVCACLASRIPIRRGVWQYREHRPASLQLSVA